MNQSEAGAGHSEGGAATQPERAGYTRKPTSDGLVECAKSRAHAVVKLLICARGGQHGGIPITAGLNAAVTQ